MADNPGEVIVLGSSQQTNGIAYALGKLARGGIGTRHYDTNMTLCMASAITTYYRALGNDTLPSIYDDIPGAETHLVWGANPVVARPVIFRQTRQSADDGNPIVVDPVEAKTAGIADDRVTVDSGGDLTLAQAILGHLVETDRVNGTFVEEHTEGFDRVIDEFPPVEGMASKAGITLDKVEKLMPLLNAPTLVCWGMDVNQSIRGITIADVLVNLCPVSGNFDPGSSPLLLTGQANSMGTRMASPRGT